jgi:hypothetical protein
MLVEISGPDGFNAVLTDECWHHIVIRHPEMSVARPHVLETLRLPDGIFFGKRDPSRRVYRKRYAVAPVGSFLDLLVFVDDESHFVATSYFAAYSLRMLGRQIWPLT